MPSDAYQSVLDKYSSKKKEDDTSRFDAVLYKYMGEDARKQYEFRNTSMDLNVFGLPETFRNPEPIFGRESIGMLGFIERAAQELAEEIPKVPAAARSGVQESIGGAASTIGSPIAAYGDIVEPALTGMGLQGLARGATNLSEQGRIFADTERHAEAQRIRQEARIAEGDVLASAARAGGSVFPMGAAMVTGNPAAAAGVMSASVFGPEFIEGKDKLGLGNLEAATRGTLMAGIEAVTERVGFGTLMKGGLDNILSKPLRELIEKSYGAKVGGAMIANAAEELAATEAQFIADETAGWKFYTPEEKAQARKDSLIAGLGMAGAVRSVTALAEIDRTKKPESIKVDSFPVLPPTGDPKVDTGIAAGAVMAEQAETFVADMLGDVAPKTPDIEVTSFPDEPDIVPFEPVVTKTGKDTYTVTTPAGSTTMTGLGEEGVAKFVARVREDANKPRPAPEMGTFRGFGETAAPEMKTIQGRVLEPTSSVATPDVDAAQLTSDEKETRRKEIGQIKALSRTQKLDDPTYRSLLTETTGKDSAAKLTQPERMAVIQRLSPIQKLSPQSKAGDPPQKEGTIRYYHGTAYKDASGFTSKTYVTPERTYAENYRQTGNNVLYTDFTREEAAERGLIDEVNGFPINGSIDDGAKRLVPLTAKATTPAAIAPQSAPIAPKATTGPAASKSVEPPAIESSDKPSDVPNRLHLSTSDDVSQQKVASAMADPLAQAPVEEQQSIRDTLVPEARGEAERSARVVAIKNAIRKDSSTRGVETLSNLEVVTREDAPEGMDVDNDGGMWDRNTNKIYINADFFFDREDTKPEDAAAVALHEIAHPFDQSGKKTGRPSIDRIVGEAPRKALIARVNALASGGSEVAQKALAGATDAKTGVLNPNEVLTYFIEEAKLARGKQGMGRRVAQVVKDIVAAVKGYIQDKEIGGKNWKITEADIFRAAELMVKSAVKEGTTPQGKGSENLKSFRPLPDFAGDTFFEQSRRDREAGFSTRLKNPVTLKDGTRLSGFTDNNQAVFYGFDSKENEVTVRVSSVKPDDILSSKDSNKTAEKLREGLQLRDKNNAPLKSTRPAQQRFQDKAKESVKDLVDRVDQELPTTISPDRTILGVNDELDGGSNVGEGTGVKRAAKDIYQKGKDAVAGAFSPLANVSRSAFEAKRQQSEGTVAELDALASQIKLRMERAIERTVRGPNTRRPFRRETILEGRRRREIGELMEAANIIADTPAEKVTKAAALNTLKEKYKSVFNAREEAVAEVDRRTVLLMKMMVNQPGGMTNADVASIRRMKKQMGQYISRLYLVNESRSIRNSHIDSVLERYKEATGQFENEADVPEDKRVFIDAKNWIKAHVLNISEYNEVVKAAKEDITLETLAKLQLMYEMWIPSEQQLTPIQADSTIEQREAWVDKVREQLQERKRAISDVDYVKELEDKSVMATKDFILAYRNQSNTRLVEYFSSTSKRTGILKRKKDIPAPIRKLLGEIVEPVLQFHQTLSLMASELAQMGQMTAIWNGNNGRLWVNTDQRSDPKIGDKFTQQISGDKYGPLNGKWVEPELFNQLNEGEKIQASLDSLTKAWSEKKASAIISITSEMVLDGIAWGSRKWKMYNIVTNIAGAGMDAASTVVSIAGDGWAPYANKDGRAFAFAAAWNLINVSERSGLNSATAEMLRTYMTDSAFMGEIQAKDYEDSRRMLTAVFVGRRGAVGFYENTFGKEVRAAKAAWATTARSVADLKAVSDLVGKFYNYYMEKQFQRELDIAKKESDPSFKPRSERQLEIDTSALVSDTNVGYERGAPVAQVSDRLLFTIVGNFTAEIGRTAYNKFHNAHLTRVAAAEQPDGSRAQKLLKTRAAQRYAGAVIYSGANTALIAARMALISLIGMAVAGTDEEDDFKKEKELVEAYIQTLPPGERSKVWMLPDLVNGKLVMFDGSRADIAGSMTQMVIDAVYGSGELAVTGRTEFLERAAGQLRGQATGSPLRNLVTGRTPRLAREDPAEYRLLEERYGESAAVYIANAKEVAYPRILKQVGQIFSSTSIQNELDPARKVLLATGGTVRWYDPKYKIPQSAYDFKDTQRGSRESLLGSIRIGVDSESEFKSNYLGFVEDKMKTGQSVLAAIRLSRAIGLTDEDIKTALSRDGISGKEGGGVNKGDIGNFMNGEVTQVILTSSDLEKKKEKDIAAMEAEFKGTPQELKAEVERIGERYTRYGGYLDTLNRDLREPTLTD